VRSSGRIPKQIPILLIGSDLNGKVFSESTTTVLLSLHGAGILSRHKLSPEQELILRWPQRNKETDIRVVGHLGEQSGCHTYGVAFFDQALNFWEIDFPPMTEFETQLGVISLVCSSCGALEKIDDASVEADVCATNDSVLRSCKRCGAATLWKPASGAIAAPQQPVPAASAQLPLFSASAAPPPPAPAPSSHYDPAPSPTRIAPPVPPPPQPSFYAQSRDVSPDSSSSSNFHASRPDSRADAIAASADVVGARSDPVGARPGDAGEPQAAAESEPQAAVLTMPGPTAEKPAAPRVNRRKHPRVKVSYSACIRLPGRADDIVQCEDMSKGGLRFKSRQRYYAQSFIEVAVPYQPGQPAIFVPAQIVFAEELPEQRLFRCGVQYLSPTKPRDSF
jgi:PilZ domain